MKSLSFDESVGIIVAVVVIAILFFGAFSGRFMRSQAAPEAAKNNDIVVVDKTQSSPEAAAAALKGATDAQGNVVKLVIQDTKDGEGRAVKEGDIVTVDYTGLLRDGTQFDSSIARGTPFTFQVGAGKVIKGWDQGLIGMKVGGERVLIIPPSLGYGDRGMGPIPANSPLLFSITLKSIE